jgi:hypothetical protein
MIQGILIRSINHSNGIRLVTNRQKSEKMSCLLDIPLKKMIVKIHTY